MARHCRQTVADAFWSRFGRTRLRRFVRGPAFIFAAAAAVLLFTVLFSGGLQFTRAVLGFAPASHLPPAPAQFSGDDWRQELFVAHLAPIAFALAIGVVLVAMNRPWAARYNWRCRSFLALKTTCVALILPILWMEVGVSVWGRVFSSWPAATLAGLLSAVAFVLAFGRALVWSFADQRRRCPVCIGRLGLPVTIGSWASVFEPVTTECVCESGHGFLSMPEAGTGQTDRWIPLDASWRELFATSSR
jgi:hypothetical protein